MARSAYVYVIQWNGGGASDMATFTVKHEAQSYMRRGLRDGWLDEGDLQVFRLPDGGGGAGPAHYSVADFLAE